MVLLVPPRLLETPPSLEDGIDAETEESLRVYGAELIQRAGKLLKLPQMTVASATAIFQRFYFCKSFAEFEVRSVAAAAVALATKLEENLRRLAHVIVIFYRLEMRDFEDDDGKRCFAGQPVPALEIGGKDFEARKSQVTRAERYILRELGFEVTLFLDLPHKYILRYAAALAGDGPSPLAKRAWSYMNDALRTTLCCSHQPDVIAAAGILLAARSLGLRLPRSPPWWAALDVDLVTVKKVAAVIAALYRRTKARYVDVPPRKKKLAAVVSAALDLPPATPLAELAGIAGGSPAAESDVPDEDWQGDKDGGDTPNAAAPPQRSTDEPATGANGRHGDSGRAAEDSDEAPAERRKEDRDAKGQAARDREGGASGRRREEPDRKEKGNKARDKEAGAAERRKDKDRGRDKAAKRPRARSSSSPSRSSSPRKGKRKTVPRQKEQRKGKRESSSESDSSSHKKTRKRRRPVSDGDL